MFVRVTCIRSVRNKLLLLLLVVVVVVVVAAAAAAAVGKCIRRSLFMVKGIRLVQKPVYIYIIG